MTYKTFSDNAKTFTFTYDSKDFDTAQNIGKAIMGYMLGTYEQPAIEITYRNDGKGGYANRLIVEYVEDTKLNKVFKRICDGFKIESEDDKALEIENQYRLERVQQLKQSEDFDSLLEKVVAYELELLDYAERLLSDEPIPMDAMTAYSTLETLGARPFETLKAIDTEQEYKGLWDYNPFTE
ncbi:hypothetical protein [Streptococcus suis]